MENGGDKNRNGMEAGRWEGRGDDEEGRRKGGGGAYNVHIGQAHFPSEERSGDLPVTEVVGVMVRWISHFTPGPEPVVAVTSPPKSSSPSSSVLRLRSMTSLLVVGGGTLADWTRRGSPTVGGLLASSWLPGRWKNPT